ncbi:pyridoxal kinase, putative [Hepatocystis sp. ex Piliocolobus tephrosceles]|nr:pyridoxal kinase, putative [Hepatocystis sp. ex Piliocolobus tephrosceles]
MDNKNNEIIVSVQSQVFDGFCGNNIGIFVLRRRGHIPKILNTVQYYSKYKHIGSEISNDVLKNIINEFCKDNLSIDNSTNTNSHTTTDITSTSIINNNNNNNKISFLTGYMKTYNCVEIVMNAIVELKKKKKIEYIITNNKNIDVQNKEIEETDFLIENIINLNYFWICDPVLADNGKLYVHSDVVKAYKKAITYADIITPNQFELGLLSDTNIKNEKDVINSIDQLLNNGCKIVIVTSVLYSFDDPNLFLYIGFYNSNKKLICFKFKIPRYNIYMCGTGDLFTALLLSFILKQKGNILKIISNVLNIMQHVISNSVGSIDLRIIENQDIIASDGEAGNLIKEELVSI